MKIDRNMWKSVRHWKEMGVWGGIFECPAGEVVCAQFLFWLFEEGFGFFKEDERLEWIVVENLQVVKAVVSKEGKLYQAFN